ncbi:dolichyldiphosphatase SCDLUD_000654 [Saccharomycodes ludwigii]|uniref:dolichyldiphosphatase n=1 Tax=Saccharomycodes ludwigii TaxID=36035 RepID=UPI001E868E56|nr:hypothetical protein SCDLUD_000654 [Saccharomycodes ludwigii]KAH3903044.1 hypothetical protein SCDLUD_000654 [Saccharomycodes ludwigii]
MDPPSTTKLIPFDDTYVLYNPDDILSFLSCYLTLLPVFILVFYLSWFIVTRELEACILAGGHVLNDILNNIIKNIVKQPRPHNLLHDSFQTNTILRSGYGMPSAHSQFMGFLSMYLILKLYCYWDTPKLNKIIGSITIVITSLLVAASRVYLQYHSIEQVLMGLVLGASLASFYFIVVSILREWGITNWLLTWTICQRLWIKDSCYYKSQNLQTEYTLWKQRCKVKID